MSAAMTSSPPTDLDTPTDIDDLPEPDVVPLVVGADGITRPSWASRGPLGRDYYDTEWGRDVRTERGLFELMVLLVFAGGLTFDHVLGRRTVLRDAFAGFDPAPVAGFDEATIDRLLADPAMIRNRRKIAAVIANARATLALRDHGGLTAYVWGEPAEPGEVIEVDPSTGFPRRSPRSIDLGERLREAGFTHVGPVMAQSLLVASGALRTAILQE